MSIKDRKLKPKKKIYRSSIKNNILKIIEKKVQVLINEKHTLAKLELQAIKELNKIKDSQNKTEGALFILKQLQDEINE